MRHFALKKLLAAAALFLPVTLPAADDAVAAAPAASSAPATSPAPAAVPPAVPPAAVPPAVVPPSAGEVAPAPPPPPVQPPRGPRMRPDRGERPERGGPRGERFARTGGGGGAMSANPAMMPPGGVHGAPPAAAAVLSPADVVGPVILTDAELTQVITLFEKLSGKNVLRPLLPNVRINLDLPENITRAQALLAVETLLAKNAVSLSPIPNTDFFNATYNAGAVTEVPPLYTSREEVEKLPPTLSTISRLFVLQHTTAQVLDPALQTLVNRQRNETVLTFPTGNAVLFTSTVQNVQRAEKIVAALDVPNSVLFFKLKHVRASDVEKYLTSLYTGANSLRNVLGGDLTIKADDLANHLIVVTTPQNREKVQAIIEGMDKNNVELMTFKLNYIRPSDVKKLIQSLQGNSTGGVGMRPGYGGGGATPVAASAFNNVLGGDFVIEADDLANRLIIVAQPQIRDRLKKVIEEMDQDSVPKTASEILPLRHSDAPTVLSTLQAIVLGATNNANSPNANNANRNTSTSSSNTRLTGSTSSGTTASRSNYSVSSFSTRKTTTQNVPNAYTWGPGGQIPATITQPGTPNSFSDHLTVTAEERTNRLIVYGTEDDIKQVKDIVAKIDVPLPQVRIEAIIVEVNLSNGEASGLSSLGIGYKSGAAANITGYPSQFDAPEYAFHTSGPTVPGASTPPFAISGSLRDLSLSVALGLNESNSRVRVLSAPTISTTHNQEAKISVGERRPYSGGTTYSGNAAYPMTSTEFADINLELIVLPRISADGTVEMQVSQSNKSLAGSVTINDNPTPIVSERSASSILVARNDEIIVLAGLQSYQETHTKGIMWLLGYIPLIGEFFRPETNDTKRTELIVFLRPHVITPEDAKATDRTPGLLPGSLTRIDAKSYIDTGRFSAVSLTAEERAAIEEIRRTQNENALATHDDQLRHEHSDPAKPAK